MSARLTPDLIRALFAEAASLEFGLRIPVEAIHQIQAKDMITATLKATPEREAIMLCAFPKDNEMWLVKKTVEVVI